LRKTVIEKVIKFIFCKVEASVELFSKICLKLAVTLRFPKVYKVGKKEVEK